MLAFEDGRAQWAGGLRVGFYIFIVASYRA